MGKTTSKCYPKIMFSPSEIFFEKSVVSESLPQQFEIKMK